MVETHFFLSKRTIFIWSTKNLNENGYVYMNIYFVSERLRGDAYLIDTLMLHLIFIYLPNADTKYYTFTCKYYVSQSESISELEMFLVNSF